MPTQVLGNEDSFSGDMIVLNPVGDTSVYFETEQASPPPVFSGMGTIEVYTSTPSTDFSKPHFPSFPIFLFNPSPTGIPETA
jgi:hypothetical protein